MMFWSVVAQLARAGVLTIEIATGSWFVSVVLGLIVAVMMEILPRPARWFVTLLLVCVRGVPQLVVMYLVFYGLGGLGINIPSLAAAIFSLGVVDGAFAAEYYRASLLTTPLGQRDAAFVLGLSRVQQLRFVLIPQGIPFLLPPLLNLFVGLLKLATIASGIGVSEILYQSQAIMNQDYKSGALNILQVSLVVIVLYLLFTIPVTKMIVRLERRLRLRPSALGAPV
jgi:His/Glu/Gln/Arg/opine family amino acid ABC transporter permease subunit